MNETGVWLMASLNSHGTTKGMRVKFRDVECYRDLQYDYGDNDLAEKEFNIWNPLSLDTIKKNEQKPALMETTNVKFDSYTESLALELGLRSLKQQSNGSDMDQLDLSFLDYEVVDVTNGTQSFTAQINGLNDTSPSKWLDAQNLTGFDLLNQQISSNATANLTGVLQGKNFTASDSNDTTVSCIHMPSAGNKTSLSVSKDNIGKNGSIDWPNSSTLEAYSHRLNSSEKVNPFISKCENVTAILLKNDSDTVKLPMSNAVNKELNDTSSLKNLSNETGGSSIPPFSTNDVVTSNFEKLNDSESTEEVFIFVKGKKAGLIKTTSVKTSEGNWTYNGTHQIVSAEIPDDMKKYFEKSQETNKKKTRKVILPHRPQKGHRVKTKRRKEYKPQLKTGLPLSPRGFNPYMSPRGARPQRPQPVRDGEMLMNMPVVIGVPRPDFSDYDLYLPGNENNHLELEEKNVKANEYDYVDYKDLYRSSEDAKNFHLDQTKKYIESKDKNTITYFIAAEEVQWDYAGYGQR